MSRIYVSTSWKNAHQPQLVEALRKHGHKVYDFRHPFGRDDCNVWERVCGVLGLFAKFFAGQLTPEDFSKMLSSDIAQERFHEHFDAMQDADTCILLLPCGASSHSEAGFMKGLGKRVFVLDTRQAVEPELMYLMHDGYTYDKDDIIEWVSQPIPGICRVCGCSDYNPCRNPHYGNCSWVDEEHTLCSHCADLVDGDWSCKDDPDTVHCVNDRSNAFDFG